MMAALQAGGVSIQSDGVREPDSFNPRGYFEHETVRTLDVPLPVELGQAGKAIKILTHKLRYLRPEPPVRIVFMHRDLSQVVKSQESMAPAGRADVDWPGLWEKELARARSWIDERPRTEMLQVEFAELLETPAVALGKVAAFLDGGLDVQAMAATIEPRLSAQFTYSRDL